ncbi:MAG: GumC family protein [Sphingomonadaceae bacterium]
MSERGPTALDFPRDPSHRQGGGFFPTDLSLAMLWRVAVEWRWLILGAIGLGLAVAVIVTTLTEPRYRSTVLLEINPPTVTIMNDQDEMRAPRSDQQFLATQYGLLQSRSLAERVVQDLNLAANPQFISQEADLRARQKAAAGKLLANTAITPAPDSRLITLTYTSESPELAARIANSYAKSFINSTLERRYQASSYARDFLQRQIARTKADLEASERALVSYAQRQGIIRTGADAGEDAATPTGDALVALNQALAAAETKRITAEERYRQAAKAEATVEARQNTAPMRQQKATLEAEYQEKLNTFKPDYPDMVRLRTRIEALDEAIAREASQSRSSRLTSLLSEYRAAAAEERRLQARVEQLKRSVLNLRGRNIQYNILQRDVDTNRSIYDALLQRYKEIGVAEGVGTSPVSIVDRADVPGSPYVPNIPMNLGIGLLLGLIGGFGTALAIEFINDTIKTKEDVREKLHLPALGLIPRKTSDNKLVEEIADQRSQVAEAYFSVWTSLQFTPETGLPKTLLISSTRAAEGKSNTSFALAQITARMGKTVLLIDADLRKPAFIADSSEETGLSKLLTTNEGIADHLLATDHERLCLLPSGPLPPNPAELLASPRMRAIMAEAAGRFDMVIVDAPPVLGLADAPLLAEICQATLLVVESGKTRTRAALDAVGRLKLAGANIIGAVLTKVRNLGQGYGYSYEPYRYGEVESRDREIRLTFLNKDQ